MQPTYLIPKDLAEKFNELQVSTKEKLETIQRREKAEAEKVIAAATKRQNELFVELAQKMNLTVVEVRSAGYDFDYFAEHGIAFMFTKDQQVNPPRVLQDLAGPRNVIHRP